MTFCPFRTMMLLICVVLMLSQGASATVEFTKLVFPDESSAANYILMEPDFSGAQEEISICAWVKSLGGAKGNKFWLSYATSVSVDAIGMRSENSRMSPGFFFGNDLPASSAGTIQQNKWIHQCFTWSRGKVCILIKLSFFFQIRSSF